MRLTNFLMGLVLIASCQSQAASPWTWKDTVLEVASEAGIINEWGQTRYMIEHPQTNYIGGLDQHIMGKYPKKRNANEYFEAWLLVHPIISYKLPNPFRNIWQAGTICFEFEVNQHNVGAGARVRF